MSEPLRNKRMQFGHNTNVTVGEVRYHVQTEDRGGAQALIDTMVYLNGRVVHRLTTDYRDLLPIDAANEPILKQRVDEQHQAVMEELRSQKLQISPALPKPGVPAPAALVGAAGPKLSLRIQNAGDWLRGRHASLKVRVTDEMSSPVGRAHVTARIEGAAEPVEVGGLTDEDGTTSLEFDIPKFTVEDPFLIVDASWGRVGGRLRLQLKPRPPKVPTT